MSYAEPKQIYLRKHDVFIAIKTHEVVRLLETELAKVGLKIAGIQYYENMYCPERSTGCDCPHWFAIGLQHLNKRIFEPSIWFWVCKRKRVYEVRWGSTHAGKFGSFVADDFWINNERDRTQSEGKYIHSYGLEQVAQDIHVAYQAAEIQRYASKDYAKYYSKIFKRSEE